MIEPCHDPNEVSNSELNPKPTYTQNERRNEYKHSKCCFCRDLFPAAARSAGATGAAVAAVAAVTVPQLPL